MPMIKIISSLIISLVFATVPARQLFADSVPASFLYDEESEEIKEVVEKSSKKEGRYPVDVAYNVQAALVKGTSNSVMVTWDVHPDFRDDLIIGRASEIINTRERALSSTSIKVLNARDSSVYVDADLPPGSYYYVVLSKDRVSKRDVEIFPDVNHTSFPAVISAPAKKESASVRKLTARKISADKVLLSWKGTGGSGIMYTVYRAMKSISSDDDLSGAIKVVSLTDAEQFIDDTIPVTGTYFYAVMTKQLEDREHTVFIPGETYTSEGVFVYIKYSMVIQNISATPVNGDIQVRWESVASGIEYEVDGYAVYRANIPISNYERLDFSKHIGTLDGRTTSFLDKNPGEGRHYYAVLVKFKNGAVDTRLNAGYNYTAEPVDFGGSEKFEVFSIGAARENGRIKISWRHRGGRSGKKFILYRCSNPPSSPAGISAGWILAEVDATSNSYQDENPPKGRFYYGLAPSAADERRTYQIISGSNITATPVDVAGPPEKTVVRRGPALPEMRVVTDRVDDVLHRTFFRGKYHLAIKELQDIVKVTDNNAEAAKARLFIGRSYIELNEFSRALIYLSLDDVRSIFPEESTFWREFAMMRVR